MFLNKKVILGNINVGSKHTIVFKYNADISKINKVITSCGCTLAETDLVNREIKIFYTAQDMPIHLIKEGKKSYQTTKSIVVFFEELASPGLETNETLTFTANVFRKK